MRANFASQVKKGKLTEEKLEGLMKKLHGTVTYDNFKSVDMVSLHTTTINCDFGERKRKSERIH